METKTKEVVNYLVQGETLAALKIAKDFKMGYTKEEKAILKRAFEMTWNPTFYEQLGFNAEDQLALAEKILEEKYLY